MNPLTRATRAATEAARAFRVRDDAIRQAHSAGHTIRAIAAATGLSSARIHQILHGR
jgi:hypothetical protein